MTIVLALSMHAQWGNAIFENISGSEQKHMDEVKGLLNDFGIVVVARVAATVAATSSPYRQN